MSPDRPDEKYSPVDAGWVVSGQTIDLFLSVVVELLRVQELPGPVELRLQVTFMNDGHSLTTSVPSSNSQCIGTDNTDWSEVNS